MNYEPPVTGVTYPPPGGTSAGTTHVQLLGCYALLADPIALDYTRVNAKLAVVRSFQKTVDIFFS